MCATMSRDSSYRYSNRRILEDAQDFIEQSPYSREKIREVVEKTLLGLQC